MAGPRQLCRGTVSACVGLPTDEPGIADDHEAGADGANNDKESTMSEMQMPQSGDRVQVDGEWYRVVDDTEGHGFRWGLVPAGQEDDAEGHGRRL